MCNLDRLRELTYKLADLANYEEGCVVYNVSRGRCFGISLMDSRDIGVQKVYVEKGTEFPSYTHDSRAWLIVYKGLVEFTVSGEKVKLHPGEYIYCDPGEPRSGFALQDSWLLTVSVPAADGYPTQ